jgi:hypothetical protein
LSIIEIFSKRQKKLRGEIPDVYIYNELPNALKAQIIFLLRDGFEKIRNRFSMEESYQFVVDSLCREYGVFALVERQPYQGYGETVGQFLLQEKDVEKVLDVVELGFRLIHKVLCEKQWSMEVIDELNIRFKEHGVGYQFINREIIRVDSEFLHSEVVKPALTLLNNKSFISVEQEFLGAHEHYRHGRNKEALNDCLKSLESALKIICDKRKWQYPKKVTAQPLIEICFKNKLIPEFWQTQFTALRTLLESGVPTGRNNLSGHGQGSEVISVPEYLVAYMLHMTASALVFLIKADQGFKP